MNGYIGLDYPATTLSFKMRKRGTWGSHTYLSAVCLPPPIAMLLARVKG